MASPEREIEDIKASVARYFPVYETRVRPDMLTFFVHVDQTTLDANFDAMRKSLIPRGYIPFITREKGEHVVLIQRRPRVKTMGIRVNLLLFIITISTTIFAGAVNWAVYDDVNLWDPATFGFGALFFALPLLAILGIHEMGHYLTARRYNVAASLPFFIPSFPPLGTFGALISMREPIPNRRALLDIGVAGPLFGIVVAIPVTLLGLFLIGSDPKEVTTYGGNAVALPSLLYEAMTYIIPVPPNVRFHPTAFAGWVGLFVTALNLLPAGQLDGGHVARAVLGDRARYLSYFALFVMFFLGLYYTGWFIIGLFILLLGARHPPPLNDLTKLSTGRKMVGVVAALVFIATFIPQPLVLIPEDANFSFGAPEPFIVNVTKGSTATANFTINNTGNMPANITVTLMDLNNLDNVNLTVSFERYSGSVGNATINARNFTIELQPDQSVNVTFTVDATNYELVPPTQPYTFRVRGEMVYGSVKDLPVAVNVL